MTNLNQNGRSMIEMLGVLAIIGVLSVGGITGYTRAMTKFKINKLLYQANTVINNIRIVFAEQIKNGYVEDIYSFLSDDYDETSSIILPDEMLNHLSNDGSISCENNCVFSHAFGGEFFPGSCANQADVSFCQLPKEACIALASQDYGKDIIMSVGIGPFRTEACDWGYGYLEEDYRTFFTNTTDYPISVSKATEYCSKCDNENNKCCITFTFY